VGAALQMHIALGDIVGVVLSHLEWQSCSYERSGSVSEVEFACMGLFKLAVLWVGDICTRQVFRS
jgi:hypothetical protein